MIGGPPEQEVSEGIKGLIEGHDEMLEMDPSREVLDVFTTTAAGKPEHHEIVAYGNLALLADRHGVDEAGDILHANWRRSR